MSSEYSIYFKNIVLNIRSFVLVALSITYTSTVILVYVILYAEGTGKHLKRTIPTTKREKILLLRRIRLKYVGWNIHY